MLNNAWSVWQSAWFGHDLGPLGWGQQRSIDIKSRWRDIYVIAVTFNWLSKRSNCNPVSCNMTNINTRDGSEDHRAVSKNVSAVARVASVSVGRERKHGGGGGIYSMPPLPSPLFRFILLLSQFSRGQTAKNATETLATQAISAALSEIETTRNWKNIREGRNLRGDNFKYRPKR